MDFHYKALSIKDPTKRANKKKGASNALHQCRQHEENFEKPQARHRSHDATSPILRWIEMDLEK